MIKKMMDLNLLMDKRNKKMLEGLTEDEKYNIHCGLNLVHLSWSEGGVNDSPAQRLRDAKVAKEIIALKKKLGLKNPKSTCP
jgi:hypothetical protein